MKKIKVISWSVTVLLMALIFFFSSQNSVESSGVSSGFTREIIEAVSRFFGWSDAFKNAAVDFIHGYVRKAAHFTIYAALGMSVACSVGISTDRSNKKIWIIAVVFCALYAATDEFHQYFVDGRAGRITDVGIDTAGAALGAFIFVSLKMIRHKIDYKFDGWITLTVILMVIIFAFSSQTSSESNELSKSVSGFIADIWNFFVRAEEHQLNAAEINRYVRKAAHFALYMVLGGATAVMLNKKGKFKVQNVWLISVLLCLAYAAGDELHQGFVAGRGPLISDVRLDTCGGMTGAGIYVLYYIVRYGFKREKLTRLKNHSEKLCLKPCNNCLKKQ